MTLLDPSTLDWLRQAAGWIVFVLLVVLLVAAIAVQHLRAQGKRHHAEGAGKENFLRSVAEPERKAAAPAAAAAGTTDAADQLFNQIAG